MNSDILRDKAEYLMPLISHFAERNGLSVPQPIGMSNDMVAYVWLTSIMTLCIR